MTTIMPIFMMLVIKNSLILSIMVDKKINYSDGSMYEFDYNPSVYSRYTYNMDT